MQSVYPHSDDDRHRAFNDFHHNSSSQHASWSSQHYTAYNNGEIMNSIGLPNYSSRQSDYVQSGQVHYGANNEQSHIYAPSPMTTRHDRYQNDIPDDAYLRQVALNSFPDGLPDGYKVEGLRFNEGSRDQNGQLTGGQYWELSSYCIPSHYDQAGHYNAGLTSLPSRQQQYDTPYSHQNNQPHASMAIPQPHGFHGHADSHSLQTNPRPNGLSYGRNGDTLLEPTASVMPQQCYVDEHPHRHSAHDNVSTLAYHNPIPTPAHMPRFISHYAPHEEARLDAYERSSSAHRHNHRDSRSMFVPQTPSPPLKRLGSKDSSDDGYSPPSRSRLDKSPSRRQEGLFGPSSLPSQSVIKMSSKKNSEKKQTLACLFCRERKIACGRPAEGSLDPSCNQCARRQFKCEYPKESRRGQHKRGRRKAHDVNDAN